MIDKIKKILKKINLIKVSIFAGCIIVFLILSAISGSLAADLPSQNAVTRYAPKGGYAQASAFIKPENAISVETMLMFDYQLTHELEERAFEEEEGGGRSYIYAYSAPVGELRLRSSRASATATATAVGGDFFIFHPYKLLSGSYFGGDDENGDGVMLDADTAWTLFGSSNVAGMEVEINDRAYPVRGVIQREKGSFAKTSGDEKSMIFVSFGVVNSGSNDMYDFSDFGMMDTMSSSGTGATCFEMLMKNPVKHFVPDVLTKVLKDSFALKDEDFEVVENSSRFSFVSELNVLKNFGNRSMKMVSIVYPGWENRARAYEDVLSVLLLFRLLLLIYPIVFAVKYGIIIIKLLHKKIKSVINNAKNKINKRYEKKWLERQEANE